MTRLSRGIFVFFLSAFMLVHSAFGQTTEFTYQGQLQASATPASGSFDFEFLLFDGQAGGFQVGSAISRSSLPVTNGVFSVNLDFGSSFSGSNRFLEIRVRQSGAGSFTTLSPRQPVTSSPYSIKSLTSDNAATATTALNASTATNAVQLGGVEANQYLQTNGNGSGLTNLNAGSITTGTLANSRIGPIQTANIADNAVTAAKIASGQTVKSVIVGAATLTDNVTLVAGSNVTITPAGSTVTIASTGNGGGVGGSGTISTIPLWSGGTTLSNSQITESSVGVQLPNGVQLAVGAQGNQLAFGSPNGETGLSISSSGGPRADLRFDGSTVKLVTRPAGTGPPNNGIVMNTSGNVGIGTTNLGTARLRVDGFNLAGVVGVSSFDYGVDGQGVGGGVRGFSDGTGARGVYGVSLAGIGVEGSSNGSNNFAVFSNGFMGLDRLGSGGNTTLCRNAANQIATCGSSLRYKMDVRPFAGGLNMIELLQPVTYRWKSDQSPDVGFVAEEVAKIEPLLTILNEKGEVEGIKYDRLSVVFVNSLKQQQRQIETLQNQIEQQKNQIETLKKMLCVINPKASTCQP